MATNIDRIALNRRLRTRLVCRRTEEESDQSASWYWAGNLCFDMVSGYWRLVGPSQREDEEKNL